MWFSLTCVDERAEGEGAILFIKGEIEDVQVADAGYPHWLTVFDVAITVDVSHENWRSLICIHAECEKDREVKAVGSPSDLALILSQAAHFCAPAPLIWPPPSTCLRVLRVSDAAPFWLSLCLAPIGYIMLSPGNMVSFLLFSALTLTAPQWRYLEDIWKPQVLSYHAQLPDTPAFLCVPGDEWIVPDLENTMVWDKQEMGTGFSLLLSLPLHIPFFTHFFALPLHLWLQLSHCHRQTCSAFTSSSVLSGETWSLALDSLGWSHWSIGFHDLGLCHLLPEPCLCPT